MPPGNTRFKPPARVIEKTTVGACLAIAHRIEHEHELSGDVAGASAAHQVATFIEVELLRLEGASHGSALAGLPRRT